MWHVHAAAPKQAGLPDRLRHAPLAPVRPDCCLLTCCHIVSTALHCCRLHLLVLLAVVLSHAGTPDLQVPRHACSSSSNCAHPHGVRAHSSDVCQPVSRWQACLLLGWSAPRDQINPLAYCLLGPRAYAYVDMVPASSAPWHARRGLLTGTGRLAGLHLLGQATCMHFGDAASA